MSLDVKLVEPCPERPPVARIVFIRADGAQREISWGEWMAFYPGQQPVTVTDPADGVVYEANITHNLRPMAAKAGLYVPLWTPEVAGYEEARDLIRPLKMGLARLEENPALFRTYNPPNGWGTYEGLVRFVRGYLEACEAYPAAQIRVSR